MEKWFQRIGLKRAQKSELSLSGVVPEIRLVVAALAAGHVGQAAQFRDWKECHWDAARAHGLTPWLYSQLLRSVGPCLPTRVQESLQHDYRLSALMAIFRDIALQQALEVFDALALPVAPLKGVYLSSLVYDDPAHRTMCDMDLLVGEADFDRARNALISMGYTLMAEPLDVSNRASYPALSYVRVGAHPDAIDLHHQLCCMDHYCLPRSAVWSERLETRLYGRRVWFLSPELNFIHLGAHSLNHGPLLRDWLDLVLILRRTTFQWDKFATLATAMGVLRPMYWVVRELIQHWGVQPPNEVTKALADYRPRPLEDRVMRSRWRYLWRSYSKVSACDGLHAKIRHMRFKIFPPVDYRNAVVGSGSWLRYMTSKIQLFLHLWRRS